MIALLVSIKHLFESITKAHSVPCSGVNFINVFMCSFYAHRSQKRKKLLDLTVFFMLRRSARVKAAHRTSVKLNPGDDGYVGAKHDKKRVPLHAFHYTVSAA